MVSATTNDEEARKEELPAEVYEHLTHLRWCVCAMYMLSLLRVFVEPQYMIGSVIEALVATVACDVLRLDPACPWHMVELPGCGFISSCEKLRMPPGLGSLKLLVVMSLVGGFSELRKTWYMTAEDATTLGIIVPLTVFANVLLYFSVFLFTLQVRFATWSNHGGNYYAKPSVANANVGRPEPMSDDEDKQVASEAARGVQMEPILEAVPAVANTSLVRAAASVAADARVQREEQQVSDAPLPLAPATTAKPREVEEERTRPPAPAPFPDAWAPGFANPDMQSEQEQVKRAQEESLRELEEVRLKRQRDYNARHDS